MASNPLNSTNSSELQPHGNFCTSPFTKQTLTAWFVVYLLCFPVFLSTLYIFFQKMRTSIHLSHSDIFTSQIVVMEIVNTVGSCVIFHGVYVNVRDTAVSLAVCVAMLTRFGQMSFHSLTCFERYLAVVHPITYLRLKTEGGVIVNACIVSSWLFSAGLSALVYKKSLYLYHYISSLLAIVFSSAIVSFCAVSTLCALIRPGPGEGGGDRRSINQSKRAALCTMAFILGAELLSIF
ncbi:hypothetical protein NQD34_013440 [Periophthalmus magnuspinnatus]|nr:hypothetical protein NQD34_013440 [Periophthalmus magnuspinnatus]